MSEHTEETHGHGRCLFCEAGDMMGRFFRTMGPSEEAAGHFRQSRVEFLKGIRQLVDDQIECVSRGGPQKGTRVTVD